MTWALPLIKNTMSSVSPVSYRQQSPSALDYLDFPDAVQDIVFDPNIGWSLVPSEPALLHFHTMWPDAGMPALPCPLSREQRLQLRDDGCVCIYVTAMRRVGKGVMTGRRLDLCMCVQRKEGCAFPKGLHQHRPWAPQAVHVNWIPWGSGKQKWSSIRSIWTQCCL